MQSKKTVLAGVGLGLAALALLTPTLASGNARTTIGNGRTAAAVARPFIAQLTGATEVPGPGDPDGDGAAAVTIDPADGQICVDLRASNIGTATAAHIHPGVAGTANPPAVTLTVPNPTSETCVIDLVNAPLIIANPSAFYVNVHTAAFPNGAIRGQLVSSTSTSGATRLLAEPLRVYDSRVAPAVILTNLETRIISLARVPSGPVAVPPGATGALVRVTVTNTTGAGFLTVYSNALATAPATSNVNWYEAGAIAGADLTVAVDSEARIKITVGGGSSTHVVVDVVGYIY